MKDDKERDDCPIETTVELPNGEKRTVWWGGNVTGVSDSVLKQFEEKVRAIPRYKDTDFSGVSKDGGYVIYPTALLLGRNLYPLRNCEVKSVMFDKYGLIYNIAMPKDNLPLLFHYFSGSIISGSSYCGNTKECEEYLKSEDALIEKYEIFQLAQVIGITKERYSMTGTEERRKLSTDWLGNAIYEFEQAGYKEMPETRPYSTYRIFKAFVPDAIYGYSDWNDEGLKLTAYSPSLNLAIDYNTDARLLKSQLSTAEIAEATRIIERKRVLCEEKGIVLEQLFNYDDTFFRGIKRLLWRHGYRRASYKKFIEKRLKEMNSEFPRKVKDILDEMQKEYWGERYGREKA